MIQQLKKSCGFTLIELLVVTTIIIILTTVGLVSYQRATINSRNAKRKTDLETIRQALVLYRTDNGCYPGGAGACDIGTVNFANMITEIGSYLSATTISDPKNTGNYVYTYTSDGATFTITAALEPDETAYPVSNP